MYRVLEKNAKNGERIFPYIGGADINSSPVHKSERFVIHLSGLTETEASQWPELMEICRAKVRPERLALRVQDDAVKLRERWWWFGRDAKELYERLVGMERVLGCSQTSKYLCFAFLPARAIFSHKTRIVTWDSFSAFATLQSRVHQEWAYFSGSTMKDDPVYVPSDCFETFPFPGKMDVHSAMDVAGKTYYEFRAALMVRNNEGLTKTYNRFHDPDEKDGEIVKLRELHAAMDCAVLDAYGWRDVQAGCEFLLDYEIDEEEWGDKKKPYRYRWPDEIRDEVLARLLDLNAERAKEEARSRAAAVKRGGRRPRAKHASSTKDAEDMFS